MLPDEKPARPVKAFVALGANLGDPQQALQTAQKLIGQIRQTELITSSGLYRTEPINSSGPDYVNAVACVRTCLSARELLHALQAIENRLGRVRPAGVVNAPRTMDLDLLLYGDLVCADAELVVPHPRMHERAFVLVPLTEIAPDVEIPGKGAASRFLPAVADQRIQGPIH